MLFMCQQKSFYNSVCVFRWACAVIGILPQKESGSESELLACVPPWLLLVMDDVHTLRQTHLFTDSTLTVMLVWIYSHTKSTRAHSDLRACITLTSVAVTKCPN